MPRVESQGVILPTLSNNGYIQIIRSAADNVVK
jgi:hypothetical protein